MTVFHAHFDGQVLIPDAPVALPQDCVLEVSAQPLPIVSQGESPLKKLAEIAASFPVDPDAPTDMAAQHDHYLYGLPKRP